MSNTHRRNEDDTRDAEIIHNPGNFGLGIDENWTIEFEDGRGAGLAFHDPQDAQDYIDHK